MIQVWPVEWYSQCALQFYYIYGYSNISIKLPAFLISVKVDPKDKDTHSFREICSAVFSYSQYLSLSLYVCVGATFYINVYIARYITFLVTNNANIDSSICSRSSVFFTSLTFTSDAKHL